MVSAEGGAEGPFQPFLEHVSTMGNQPARGSSTSRLHRSIGARQLPDLIGQVLSVARPSFQRVDNLS